MWFVVSRGRCTNAPIKEAAIPPGRDDHMVVIKVGISIEHWLANLDLEIRLSRYARGCDPETGERLSELEFKKILPPKWRPCE